MHDAAKVRFPPIPVVYCTATNASDGLEADLAKVRAVSANLIARSMFLFYGIRLKPFGPDAEIPDIQSYFKPRADRGFFSVGISCWPASPGGSVRRKITGREPLMLQSPSVRFADEADLQLVSASSRPVVISGQSRVAVAISFRPERTE